MTTPEKDMHEVYFLNLCQVVSKVQQYNGDDNVVFLSSYQRFHIQDTLKVCEHRASILSHCQPHFCPAVVLQAHQVPELDQRSAEPWFLLALAR